MTPKGKSAGTEGVMHQPLAKLDPVVKRTARAAAKPERSSEIFSRLIRSIDNNLSTAHKFADEAKKRLG